MAKEDARPRCPVGNAGAAGLGGRGSVRAVVLREGGFQANPGGPNALVLCSHGEGGCSANVPVGKCAGGRGSVRAVVLREGDPVRFRTGKLHLACINAMSKSSRVTKKVALAMATHFWPNEALHLLGGGRGWFPHKVKERSVWAWQARQVHKPCHIPFWQSQFIRPVRSEQRMPHPYFRRNIPRRCGKFPGPFRRGH